MQARFLPWLDRTGRPSALKLAVLVALFAPAVWIAVQYDLGWLAPKPDREAIHQSGLWAIRILLASLAVSPLRRVAHWNRLIAVRRMLGVAVLFYVLGHLTLYVVQQGFDLPHVASEIVLRLYLTIGAVALLALAVLGATSTDAMIRRIGAARWNRLHALVYPVAILALLHFMLQSKLDVSQPMLLLGLFILLMGQRALSRMSWVRPRHPAAPHGKDERLKRGDDVPGLAALAVAAPVLTALFEAAWYHLRNGIDLVEVLGTNFDLDDPLRPAWFVLLAGIAVLALRLARPLWATRPRPAAPLRAAAE